MEDEINFLRKNVTKFYLFTYPFPGVQRGVEVEYVISCRIFSIASYSTCMFLGFSSSSATGNQTFADAEISILSCLEFSSGHFLIILFLIILFTVFFR